MAGYREAECGWVMVEEEDHHEEELPKSSLRTALFLVIYATKRGILEVWEGGVEALNKVLYQEALPQCLNPYPFKYQGWPLVNQSTVYNLLLSSSSSSLSSSLSLSS